MSSQDGRALTRNFRKEETNGFFRDENCSEGERYIFTEKKDFPLREKKGVKKR